jgi:hypothetical protein
MHKGMIVGALVSLMAGCVFADTAKLGVLVLDEETGMPVEGVKVRGGFKVQARSWSAVKCSPLPNECFKFTDKNGRCKVEGETNCGEAGAAVVNAPEGYYCPSYGQGYDFKRQNMLGIWQPDDLVVTVRLQRVEHPIPLFVKKIGEGHCEDLFSREDGVLKFDFMKGEYLPPIGNGEVADVEFRRLPREELGEGVNPGGDKGCAYRDSMGVRFLGEGNGLVEMSYPENARLKIRTAPETGYKQDCLCWAGINKQLRYEESYDKSRCFCFRIRTRRDENGKIVEAYYGKIYGDIELRRGETPLVAVESVEFTYYLNPIKLDRNLEWNKQNLCDDPLYPRPEKRRLMEYKSFNREQKP